MSLPIAWPLWSVNVQDPETGHGVHYQAVRAPNREAADVQGRDGYFGLLGASQERRDRLVVVVEAREEAA